MIACHRPIVQFTLHDDTIFRICHDASLQMPCLTVLYSWPKEKRDAWESWEVFSFVIFRAGVLEEIAAGSGYWRDNLGLEDMLQDIPAKYHDEIRRQMP